jgi:phosphonate degradation associated HDIG domain protein
MNECDTANQIKRLFDRSGSSLYGGEAITQLEHGLQAAMLAEVAGAEPALIVAALVHDIGHLLHDLPDDAPDQGVDDIHERLGFEWLQNHFGPEVSAPVRMHVDAKRYLCAVEPGYEPSLSEPSRQSLLLQGGPYNQSEVDAFENQPYFNNAVYLRRWDDLAKVPNLATPSLEHFLAYVEQVQLSRKSIEMTT